MRPAKRLLAVALTMGAAGAIAAVTVAPATASKTARTPTIKLLKTSKGKLLSVGGFVVYRFMHDGSGHKNTCVKISGCSGTWPPLTTVGKPHTGPGVKASLLGTTRVGSKRQVTYAGHPIYKYAFNYPGQSPTAYVGVREFGGRWDGVNANGKAIR